MTEPTLHSLKYEWHTFICAYQFLTRIPPPRHFQYNENMMHEAARFYPLVGALIGAFAAGIFLLADQFLAVLPAVIISTAATLYLTGAFHEDGFADVCDGFGGGWTKPQILKIMKDSRVGTYALVGLILLFALKIAALISLLELNQWFALKSLVLAHVLSRWSSLTIIYTHSYSREDASSKIKPIAKELSFKNLLIGSVWVLPALV